MGELKKYLLGFDGGATGTIGILADLEGNILAAASGAASNHLSMGQDKARQVFIDITRQLLDATNTQPSDCQLATFGLSAIAGDQDVEIYRQLIAATQLSGDIIIESDVVIAWAAATAGQAGLAVIAGTGASCFGVNSQGERARSLGWDYLIADQGSGYWIGLQGLQAAVKVYDGRLEKSLLLDAMTEHYGFNDPAEILTRAYDEDFTKGKIASFAKQVSKCAAAGDAVAQGILQRAAEELGDAVIAVAHKLDMTGIAFPVGLIGGVFQSGNLVVEPFKQHIHKVAPQAQVDLASYPAVIGALILAQVRLHGQPSADFIRNLEATQGNFQQLRWK